ncbi:YvrJ family protein [Inconstantimicrobium mannanitabidum]|uniref:YvrJ family protein n=1 Tax=Inconstantimicrobium mannanitabidum TaxID=1604901 RepID=A0ACB5RIS7_9CLOT|nr:YvrJ family protein [Clostridium sp. TW13]GKX68978.1 YvrJ family protein [Clostridium sp. TW13]
MEDFIKLVANVGFPIAVAGYLLIRVETKIDKLTESIYNLSIVIKASENK